MKYIPGQGLSLQIASESEFPEHVLPIPTGAGFEQVLCLSLYPLLQVLVHELQLDHVDQPPFT